MSMAATGHLMFTFGAVILTGLFLTALWDVHSKVLLEKLEVVESLFLIGFYLTLLGWLMQRVG